MIRTSDIHLEKISGSDQGYYLTGSGILWFSIIILISLLCGWNSGYAQEQPLAQPFLQLDSGGHTAVINDIAFSPDGRYLVSASDDKTIRVWDWKQGKTVRFLRGSVSEGNEGTIYAMALSPNGKWLAVAGWMDKSNAVVPCCGDIRLYDFQSGELKALLHGHRSVVQALTFSPDSQKLISGSSDKTAIIWQVTTQKPLQTLSGHSKAIHALAFSADNQRVVTGSFDHSLRLWQVVDGQLIATLQGHTDKVNAVAVSPKSDLIASGSDDQTIRLWDAQSGKFLRRMTKQGTGIEVSSLSFSPDGLRLLSASHSAPMACYVWDVASGKKQHTYKHDNIVLATGFSPNGAHIVTAGGVDNKIYLWDSKNGKLVQTLGGQGAAIWSVGFATDGQSIAWGKTSTHISRTNRGELEQQLHLSQRNSSLGTPKPVTKKQTWQRAKDVVGDWSLQSHKSGDYGYQAILEIKHKGKVSARIERNASNGYGHTAYTFTPNGKNIISGGRNGTLSLYSNKGQKRGEFIGHNSEVWAVAVSPDGEYLVSGSDDKTVRLWRVNNQELLLTLFTGEKKDWVAWTPEGYYTASPKGDHLLGWQINRSKDKSADYAAAEQLRKHFYRPDIIDQTLRLGSAKQAVAQADDIDVKLVDLLGKGLPPKFVLSQPQNGTIVTHKMQNITLLFSAGAKATSLEAYVNGVQVIGRGKMALPARANKHEKTITLPLKAGENNIKVIAHNSIGQTIREFKLILNDPATRKKGRLFLVAVGVSDYDDNELDLHFAAKDAIAVEKILQQQGNKQYKKVISVILADGHKNPTRNNIEDAVSLFRDATIDDTVVLFISGHGINDGQHYYFLPRDAEKQGDHWRPSSVVKWRILQDALADAKGQRILLVDTCHAGNAFNPRLVNDAAAKDIIVISSTDSQSLAFEKAELGHGVFTYALLEGLKGKADALDGNKQITFKELDTWLSIHVPKLSDGAQTPVLNLPPSFKDFPFVHL
ncbi:MAG TPA: hypothetical protein ENJ33_02065 [Thiothrix sp.]|nr:hypothetical protein [Thiothrix sp.]